MTTTEAYTRTRASASPVADRARLLVTSPDGPGIVAAISGALSELSANIVGLAQHTTDPRGGTFFQRTEFDLPGLGQREDEVREAIGVVAARYDATWSLSAAARRKRVAILASTTDHCLLDLLWRQRRDEIPMDVPMVISNHPVLADDVHAFGIPFHYVPVIDGDKRRVEDRHLELLKGQVDLIVLARYMQIISGSFLASVGVPVINIHHSFLPAFIGAGPYAKAKARGVKLVGATAHYVTQDLDEGPIIEQDVARATHADTTATLTRRGADIERQVLSRAVAWHCEDRVIRHANSTVVF
ncbi:formyltetrahydrofolate deformylase [Rhodococcus sp. 14-2483-1-2]|uniref:formyltetrahydrofolate deformylase n=1 Tax=Rhodococcus sp. 14-2483-1-2 TaxID=2023147 RepID=UPI000B9BFC3B|nr:formyltetrahydrofolate deformylase [Rhodococcus sp. 14-2483-1-2]OZF26078.1 formyltetrahydrofolate deformylase [Rhodococcus sp. 14-2483-1-2]